jgi:phage terminase large subunit-like protein
MVEGESGILAISPPDFRPEWKPSTRKLVWPNGAIATTFSAEEPDQLRGPQCEKFWADEVASWKYPDTWDQLQFGCRLGKHTRGIVTTTPRPVQIIRDLIKREDVHITRGSTFDNQDNLSPAALASLRSLYEGTRLGRQELEGHILDDSPYALWKREVIDATRLPILPADHGIVRIVVGVDPSTTSGGDECGVVVAGYSMANGGTFYILDDVSIQAAPIEWARRAVDAYRKHSANVIVYEANQGGEMVAQTLRICDNVPLAPVWASKSKQARAEPISLLYEQLKVHHIGYYDKLEDELCTWEPGDNSPNRLDALVWALTWLKDNNRPAITRIQRR